MVRKIEKKCDDLNIDINVGVIVLMNLQDKLELLQQLHNVWNFRHKNKKPKDKVQKDISRKTQSENDREIYQNFDELSSSVDKKSEESMKSVNLTEEEDKDKSISSSSSSSIKSEIRPKRNRTRRLTKEERLKRFNILP